MAYAAISGWWAALYASRLRRIPLFHSVCLFAVLLATGLLVGFRWLETFGWHDMPDGGLTSVVECVWYASLLISPPMVDACVDRIERKIRQPTGSVLR